MKKNTALILIVMLMSISVYSQGDHQVIPPTPIAAQYEKYINYPTNLSTGATQIVVPLYTLKARGIKVPINISYHATK